MSVKKTITIFAAVALISAVSAETQTAAPGSQIELSDASTVIEETGITPEKEAVPDFSLVLPLQPSSLPVLADSNISADTLIQSEAPDSADASGQDVFLEGAIGAGWPGFFSGDFSVYRNIGDEPFKLEFFHESVMGIGLNRAPDGYESQQTLLSGEKQFALGDSVLIDASAGYETRTDGLQGKNAGFYDISRQNITGNFVLNWNVGPKISFTGTAGGVFNTRFVSAAGSASNTRKFAGFNSSAELTLDEVEWSAGLNLKYDAGTAQNRFEAGGVFDVDILGYANLSVSASGVFARNSGNTRIPFSVVVKTGPDAPFTGSVSAGMKSYAVDPVALQKTTPFLFAGTVPSETVEWFGEAVADVPFFGPTVLNVSADFAMTAHDGKRVLPDYAALDPATGLIGMTESDVMVLDSTLGITVPLKIFNATFGWNASWLDKTRYDRTRNAMSALTAGISFAGDNGAWGAGADVFWAFGNNPEIGFNGSYQFTKTVRLELEAVDVMTLLTGKDRLICNTYAERGGYAALFVKVNF